MNLWQRIAATAREASASAISSPIASAATVVMVAGLCATVLLTTGRTVGSEQAVLSSIDSAGTRTISVTADPSAGLTSDVLTRLAGIDGIEWAGAFGPAIDARNTRIPDGDKVAMRLAYGSQLGRLGIPDPVALPGVSAWGTEVALTRLGLPHDAGSISAQDGASYGVAGRIQLPDWLEALDTAVIVPQPSTPSAPVSNLVVIADRPDLVVPVAAAVQSVLAVDDPTRVTITTSEEIAQLRALIQGQLGTFGRGLVLLVLAVSGLLVAAILTGLVILRRKDFGRRRALGATRSLIVAMVLAQTLGLAAVGALLGTGIATVILLGTGDPMPGVAFTAAVCVLAIAVSIGAAVIPAIFAARRDPIRELRVP